MRCMGRLVVFRVDMVLIVGNLRVGPFTIFVVCGKTNSNKEKAPDATIDARRGVFKRLALRPASFSHGRTMR